MGVRIDAPNPMNSTQPSISRDEVVSPLPSALQGPQAPFQPLQLPSVTLHLVFLLTTLQTTQDFQQVRGRSWGGRPGFQGKGRLGRAATTSSHYLPQSFKVTVEIQYGNYCILWVP